MTHAKPPEQLEIFKTNMAPSKGCDFARGILEKYGWKEGKGLGRNEDGMLDALQPKIKFDKTGIGHNPSRDFTTRWWEHSYNTVAEKLIVEENKDGSTVKLSENSKTSLKNSAKPISTYNTMDYGDFQKSSTLTQNMLIATKDISSDSSDDDQEKEVMKQIKDEDLFKICGGRTAHKGARHGLKLSGKLSRIQQQEKEILQKMEEPDFMSELPQMMKKWTKQIEEGVEWLETHKKQTKEGKKDKSYGDLSLEMSPLPKKMLGYEECPNDTPIMKPKKKKPVKKLEQECDTPTEVMIKTKRKKPKKTLQASAESDKKKKSKEGRGDSQEPSEDTPTLKKKKPKLLVDKEEPKPQKKSKKVTSSQSPVSSPKRKKVKVAEVEEIVPKRKQKKVTGHPVKDRFLIQLGGAGDAELMTLGNIRKKKGSLGDMIEIPETPDRMKGFPEPGTIRKHAKKESS